MSNSQFLEHIESNIKAILQKALNSEDLSSEEALELLKVKGKEFFALQYVADLVCFEKKQNVVTFIINRNINFTNICYQKCKFCSFSLPKTDPDAFFLTIDQIRKKVIEAKNAGCTEVCIQGGINPDLKFQFYLDVLKTVKNVDPRIHIHAFSPQEIFYISKLFENSIEDTLRELKKAGLDSIPGTAAEILVDEIRKWNLRKKKGVNNGRKS